MNSHKRQHWIPETYLNAWCDPEPKCQNPRRVYRYSLDGSLRDYRPPSRIFTEENLYTLRGKDGDRDLRTEHALNRLEDAFARLRTSYLTKGRPLPPAGRRNLIWFIAAMRNRSPTMHARHQLFHARVLEIANSAEERLRAMSHEERAQWYAKTRRMPPPCDDDNHGIPLKEYRKIAARSFGAYLPEHIVIEARQLEQMHLTIVRVPASQSLITSDHPVVWWDPEDPPPSRRPLGLGRRTMQVTCPLTPYLCAVLAHDLGPQYADTDIKGGDILNMRTLYRTEETFISCRSDLVVDWHEVPDKG